MPKSVSNYISEVVRGKIISVGGKKARWTKVKDLKAGAKIATVNNTSVEWDEIVSIKPVGREQVYDIEVEGSHNFVGNGILAHNTYTSLTSTGDLDIAVATESATAGTKNYELRTMAGNLITSAAGFAEAAIANLRAGAAQVNLLISDSLISKTIVSPVIETEVISPIAGKKDVKIRLGSHSDTGSSSTDSGKLIVENASGSAVATIDEAGNASFSGELTAASIRQTGGPSLDEINTLLHKVETDQELLKTASNWNITTASDSGAMTNQLINQLTVSDLFVTGRAAMASLSLSDSLTLGTDLVFSSQINQVTNQLSNSINTLSAPLELQSLALAPIEMMAGKVRIMTNGDMYIDADLFVAGKIHANGLELTDSTTSSDTGSGAPFDPVSSMATEAAKLLTVNDASGSAVASVNASGSGEFKQLVTDRLIIAGSAPSATPSATTTSITTNASAGQATVAAGLSELAIYNPNVTDTTLVYVTPTSSTLNNVLYVKSKGMGYFTVGFNSPLTIDVTFNWWVIEIKQ